MDTHPSELCVIVFKIWSVENMKNKEYLVDEYGVGLELVLVYYYCILLVFFVRRKHLMSVFRLLYPDLCRHNEECHAYQVNVMYRKILVVSNS